MKKLNETKCVMCGESQLTKINTERILSPYPHFYGLNALRIVDETIEETVCCRDESIKPIRLSILRCDSCGYLHLYDAEFIKK